MVTNGYNGLKLNLSMVRDMVGGEGGGAVVIWDSWV